MGFAKSSVAGSFRGKVGDKIFRKLNGKTVVGQAPDNINICYSPGCLKTRHRFKITEDLAKTIKTDPLLYGLWDDVQPEGANKFSRIMKANLGVATFKGLNRANVITPNSETVPYRFRNYCTMLGVKSVGLNVDSVFAETKVYREKGDILVPPYTAYFIVYLGKQINADDLSEYKFLPYEMEVTEESPAEYQRYEIVFDEETKLEISKYSYAVVLFALVKINEVSRKYEWSLTEQMEIRL